MGAYAAWLSGTWGDFAAARTRPARLPLERTLLVSDFEPPLACLERHLGGLPRLMVLPSPPERPLPGVAYHCFCTATNPIRWDAAVDDAIRGGIDTAAFFLPGEDVHGQTLLRLRRLGVRRVLLAGRDGPRVASPLTLALWRRAESVGKQIRARFGTAPDGEMTEEQCRAIVAEVPPRRAADPGRPLRIAHFINSLNSGGAERQVCYAAVAQKEAGHDVRLVLRQAAVGDDAHFHYLLDPHGIPAGRIGARWDDDFPDAWRRSGLRPELLRRFPRELRAMVADLLGELLTRPVDVLHCYVDDCNSVGVIAACLAGVPAVVLSFRNGNPTNFPGLLRPWMYPWYRATLGRPGVRLSSNSVMGARDYERWLGLPPDSTPIIRNAFHPFPVPAREEALRCRAELGIAADAPVVAGIFRLQPEKRPAYFVECVAQLRQRVPGLRVLRVLLAGVGPLEAEVRAKLTEHGLNDVILLLGQRPDVPRLLAASDVLLLVSDWEGTPNILLEAQHCGCVPVATDAGGSGEALDPGHSGILVGLDDTEGIVAAVEMVLRDAALRRRMAEAGRAFVAERFAPRALHEENLRLYREALADAAPAVPRAA
jgi:glycosyltransferase involved in cell wall biosynthesis